jgi:diguanylate cyclase (GGDEF)-like protein
LKAAVANKRLEREREQLLREVASLREREQHLLQRAHTDPVTGLPNRYLLQDRMKQALAFEKRHTGFVALLLVDIDNFKRINDAYGHAAGDTILRCVGERLRGSIREYDTVARLGGDEFVILLPDVPDRETVVKLAEKVVSLFIPPFFVDDRSIRLTGSVGMTVHSGDEIDPETLLQLADEAMYSSKRRGKNTWSSVTGSDRFESAPAPGEHFRVGGEAALSANLSS